MLPRGNGKTTVCIRIEICHDIVYELESYVVVMAESSSLAQSRVFEVSVELENNERIRRDFGDFVGEKIWRPGKGELLTSNGIAIVSKSMASQVRGLLNPWTNARPSKVLFDDAESSEDVVNPDLRARTKRTVERDVIPSGSIDGSTCFQATGTPLHREAWLPSLRDNPGWEFRRFPAVWQWPTRMDLWERCRELWAAAGAPNPEDAEDGEPEPSTAAQIAERFYLAHKAEMDEGAEVLWPEREPIFRLMLLRWTDGEAAFAQEKQLEPRDPTLATFDMARAVRNELHGHEIHVFGRGLEEPRKVKLRDCRIVSFHDPCGADPHQTKGPRALGDFAAIVTMALERTTEGNWFGHVINVWMSQRASVSAQIEAAFEIGAQFQHERFVLEGDTYKALRTVYQAEGRKRRAAGQFWQLPLRELEQQTTNKRARMATMEPAVSNGWITFPKGVSMDYWNQWVDDPTGDHDDGPDATEGCWRLGRISRARLRLVSPVGD